jgi:hypothetical protein
MPWLVGSDFVLSFSNFEMAGSRQLLWDMWESGMPFSIPLKQSAVMPSICYILGWGFKTSKMDFGKVCKCSFITVFCYIREARGWNHMKSDIQAQIYFLKIWFSMILKLVMPRRSGPVLVCFRLILTDLDYFAHFHSYVFLPEIEAHE